MKHDKPGIKDLEDQQARGHYLLTFDATLEGPFRQYYVRFMRLHAMAAQYAALLLCGLALFIEFAFLRSPSEVQQVFLIVFAAVVPVGVIIGGGYLRLDPSARWLPGLSVGLMICAFLAVYWLETVYTRHGITYGYQTLTFVLIFNFLLLGLRFYQAQALALIGLTGLITTYWFLEVSPRDIALKTYNYLGVGALASTAGYLQEYIVRTNFLDRGIRRHQALHDGLTGLLNRHGLDIHADRSWRHARRKNTSVAVAVFDIDWFKDYNDELGHPAGDACLSRVGACLLQYTRRPLDSAARLGGEEFAVVWEDVDEQAAMTLAERVRAAVESLAIRHPSPHADHVTVSGGVIAVSPSSGLSLNTAILAADAALYEAKRKGRNRVELARDFSVERPLAGGD
ncbi:GGDEF domain-containing protein [uncultured Abyssibacter sp.]|uniref:GGDEF domain-containing protein n=1 Tax=uncultured Abyssibacter sp. TaxID=2320202 RepID=UPI0032B1E837